LDRHPAAPAAGGAGAATLPPAVTAPRALSAANRPGSADVVSVSQWLMHKTA